MKALIFDSWYDSYRGVIVLFRVIDGSIRPGMKIRFFNTGRDYQVETLGVNRPRPTPIDELGVGNYVKVEAVQLPGQQLQQITILSSGD